MITFRVKEWRNPTTNILVVSANMRKAYPIAKSLAQMGFTIIAAFHSWRSTVFSRYFHKRYKIANPYADPDTYLKQLRSLIQQYKPLIIPVGFIDVKLTRALEVEILGPPAQLFDTVSDKLALKTICEEAGIRYPFTMKKNWINESLLELPWFRMGTWVTKPRSEDPDSEEILQKYLAL